MKNEILKPMSVSRQEFIDNITALIRDCMLPPFVIESVLKDVYNEIHILSQKQYEIDLKKFKEQLKNAETDNT